MTDKIKIIARQQGNGRVWLNDREISHMVVGARCNVRRGNPLRVVLEIDVDEIEFHGDTDVKTTHPADDES